MYGFNGYQYPMGMPQMDNRFNQLQQFQWSLQNMQQPQAQPQVQVQNQPISKIVDNIDMVKIADIPMDGNVYYFPKADGAEIYGKRWLPIGQTQTLVYKLFNQSEELIEKDNKVATIEYNELVDTFNKRFDELTAKIEQLSKPTTSKSKKEVADNE